MKRFPKAALVGVILTIGGWALTVKSAGFPTMVSDKGNQKKTARDLYLRNCARCHGANGKAETELGKKLEAPDLTGRSVQRMSEHKISNVIIYGEGEMPAFEKKLSKAEIKLIAGYVRSILKD